MTNYSQLVREQRDNIQILINLNKSFTYIGNSINVDRTTISKEIKRNRYIKSNFYEAFDQKGIQDAINKCSKLSKPPYVCNNCPNKNTCNKHHLYYNSKIAQEHYENVLTTSREGIDITPNDIDEINSIIVPLIRDKKQSVNQVYINHSDILYISKPTFYKYIDLGILSLCNLDLPKKVKYKPRKKQYDNDYKRKNALLIGRTYNEFLTFSSDNPSFNICEMDTVEGVQGHKVLLTILIRSTKFMFIRLLDKKNVACVTKEINILKDKLGIKLFSKVFKIVLTDNGTEFYNPLAIEIDYKTGNKTCNVFYCQPYSSWQKNGIERNHEYIRRVFPKGFEFNNLNDKQIQRLEETINNIPRDILNGKTPYEKTLELFPQLIQKLNYKYIKPDNVSLTIENIMEDSNEKEEL